MIVSSDNYYNIYEFPKMVKNVIVEYSTRIEHLRLARFGYGWEQASKEYHSQQLASTYTFLPPTFPPECPFASLRWILQEQERCLDYLIVNPLQMSEHANRPRPVCLAHHIELVALHYGISHVTSREPIISALERHAYSLAARLFNRLHGDFTMKFGIIESAMSPDKINEGFLIFADGIIEDTALYQHVMYKMIGYYFSLGDEENAKSLFCNITNPGLLVTVKYLFVDFLLSKDRVEEAIHTADSMARRRDIMQFETAEIEKIILEAYLLIAKYYRAKGSMEEALKLNFRGKDQFCLNTVKEVVKDNFPQALSFADAIFDNETHCIAILAITTHFLSNNPDHDFNDDLPFQENIRNEHLKIGFVFMVIEHLLSQGKNDPAKIVYSKMSSKDQREVIDQFNVVQREALGVKVEVKVDVDTDIDVPILTRCSGTSNRSTSTNTSSSSGSSSNGSHKIITNSGWGSNGSYRISTSSSSNGSSNTSTRTSATSTNTRTSPTSTNSSTSNTNNGRNSTQTSDATPNTSSFI